MFSDIYFSQKGSVVKETSNVHFLLFLISLMQALTVLPFFLGSYFIASSKSKKWIIFINSFFGSYFYYLFLFLIIGNVK